jgi:hypothetical protein
MDIKPEEVEEVKIVGRLHNDDVKMVKTRGGFHILIGKKEKNSSKADALAAGSHPGIVTYQIEKMYGTQFQPAIFKSEKDSPHKVEDRTENLPEIAKNAGLELYVLNKSNTYDFILCKHGLELAKYETTHQDNELVINSYNFRKSISPNKFVAETLANTINDKAKEIGAKKVRKK